MKLDLTELAANIGKHYHYEINEQCLEAEDVRCTEPITGGIDFTNTGRLIIARGSFSTTIELECGRCLEKLTAPVQVKIEEQLPITVVQTTRFGHKEEVKEEEEEEELVEPLFQDNIFDLSEYIRQAILVETPIQPLCNDVCKGLCPTCGKNMNQGPCNCPITAESSPFSALADILEEKDQSDE